VYPRDVERFGHVTCLALVALEDEEARPRDACELTVEADADERLARLPLADLRLQRRPTPPA
jgi:hypothetical protein